MFESHTQFLDRRKHAHTYITYFEGSAFFLCHYYASAWPGLFVYLFVLHCVICLVAAIADKPETCAVRVGVRLQLTHIRAIFSILLSVRTFVFLSKIKRTNVTAPTLLNSILFLFFLYTKFLLVFSNIYNHFCLFIYNKVREAFGCSMSVP